MIGCGHKEPGANKNDFAIDSLKYTEARKGWISIMKIDIDEQTKANCLHPSSHLPVDFPFTFD